MSDLHNNSIERPSENELMLRKFDRRDKLVRTIQSLIMGIVLVFNVTAIVMLTRQARINQDISRQNEQYIKCILLLRFDVSMDQLKTREGTVRALDQCAT